MGSPILIDLKPATIVASPNMLKFGVSPDKLVWWNFDRMMETWEILDLHPDTPIENLPLFFHQYEVVERGLHREPKLDRVKRSVEIHRDLYFDIRDNGYREIGKPITVHIDRNGVISIGNGHHRISMLRHLGYKGVKVRVESRHKKFMAFKHQLYNLYNKKFLYQPVNHPDFMDWEVNPAPCQKVLDFVLSNVEVNGKRVLDVGCCTGWFSYMLSRAAAEVTGIDVDSKRIMLSEYQRTYREAEPNNPVFINQSVQKHLRGNIEYDVVFLLNVIHHYLRKDVETAMNMINQISQHTNYLVVQLSTKTPLTINDFIEQTKRRTEFKTCLTHTLQENPSRPVLLFKK